jgi:hypothetical protein
MTKTYMINAWCLRPFITCIDVEAETPEHAIAIARSEQGKLLDAAEECSRNYAWDEFAVYDENGTEVLHERDQEPCLHHAPPNLPEGLRKPADKAAVRCQQAITAYSNDDAYTNLVDFLADAMHYCHLHGHSFRAALDTAVMHFEAEMTGDDILDDLNHNQPTEERKVP